MTRRLAAAGASVAMTLMMASPAMAVPGPRSEQWWFSAWGIQERVWPVSKGAGVTVAVIDTGVNAQLPDLRDAVVPGADLGVDDGNGGGSGDGRADTDRELGGHGTGMAFLIASRGVSTGFVGVAPEAKILPIVSSLQSTAKAIKYAADHGARVISISQSYPKLRDECSADLQAAVGYAIQRDVVIVAGAGNDGESTNPDTEPAMCAGVLAVGAVDNVKRAWVETQRKPYVSVAAPGVQVGTVLKDGRFKRNLSGTSQATALTSAVAALIRSKYPQMPAREVVQRIISTAKDAGPSGDDEMTGHGVVIPEASLTANVSKTEPNPVFDRYDQWVKTQPDLNTPVPVNPGAVDAGDSDGSKDSGMGLLLIGLAALAVVLIGTVVVFVLMRRRRPASAGGAPVGMPVPPQANPYGPPPGWGGPGAQPPADPSQGGHGQQFTPPQR